MREIQLFSRNGSVKGSFTVDDEDYERVAAYRWTLRPDGYVWNLACGRISRWLLDCTDPNLVVDHIDRCRTNNCRANLRLATMSLNAHNKQRSETHKNKYVGVVWNQNQQKWEVKFCGISYGKYSDEEHAARVYNYFARQKFGSDASLNDVPDDPDFTEPHIARRTTRGKGGVYYYPPNQKWGCRPTIEGKKVWLGYHPTQEKAFKVLQEALDEAERQKDEQHLSTPITRNEMGVAVIPVKSKDKILEALVDDDWWHKLMKRSWYAVGGYAVSGIAMHLVIKEESRQPGKLIDHINGDKLDNRLINLRVATPSQNSQNKKIDDSRQLPRGVYQWANTFYARINFEKRSIKLGKFSSADEAARAYDDKARELFGEHARTNCSSM